MICDKQQNKYYKVALHLHTTRSDGFATPEEAVQLYRLNGYDAIAITDHWHYACDGEIDGMPVIPGCEYNTGKVDTVEGVMHILGLGMPKDPHVPRNATNREIAEAIVAAGGLAVLAHPAWSLNRPEELAEIPALCATEIYNSVSEAHESRRADSSYFVDLCANRGCYPLLLATDDAHFYDGTDTCRGFVMIRAAECSTAALLDALRRGDFFASQGPLLFVTREGDTLSIDCSPASVISVQSSFSITRGHTRRGEGLTHAEYELREGERWARVEIEDAEGRRAWSQLFVK